MDLSVDTGSGLCWGLDLLVLRGGSREKDYLERGWDMVEGCFGLGIRRESPWVRQFFVGQ